MKAYPDYYPEKPGATAGGRVLEPVSFDGARLGVNFGRLRPPLPEFTVFGGMMVNRLDIPHLRKVGRSLALDPARAASCFAICAATAWRAPGNDAASGQCAGGASLCFAARAKRRHPVRRARRAAVDRRRCRQRRADQGPHPAAGRSSHARASCWRPAASRTIRGFREQFFPGGAGLVSATAPAGTGDGLHVAMAAGASINTRVASPAYWVPASLFRARRWQPGSFPAYGDRPGEAGRHCGQCVGKAFCQ